MMRTIMLSSVALAGTVIGCKSDNRSAAPNPVEWTVSDSTAEIRSGSAAMLHVTAAIDSGWYIYSLTQKSGGPTPMTISIAPSPPFRLEGSVGGPKPVVIFDKEFGIETERYEGKPSFTIPVAVGSTTGARSQTLNIKVRYQACNESFCIPARTTVLSTPVTVKSGT